ncbi:MAG TPA: ribonuclease HII [Candidatus Nanoarchaeia archaeon]|nr:ribonuclease HII [Candidatus Nanoarchaeia archaeon]
MLCGIDEAGRGPVIGPLTIAGVLVDEKDLPKLKSLGVKDSKLLTRQQREDLFEKIKKTVNKYKIIIVQPAEIDDAVNSDELNLNWLEAHKAAEIINALKPEKTIVDSPSNNCNAYRRYLLNLLHDKKIELICMHKADVKHVEVGAASILAKVVRDREMDKIQQQYGNCGPGYPSNETTQEFLAENWEKFPEIFRKSWSSYQNHVKKKHQKQLGDFEEYAQKK